jgi:hypothetical protein
MAITHTPFYPPSARNIQRAENTISRISIDDERNIDGVAEKYKAATSTSG